MNRNPEKARLRYERLRSAAIEDLFGGRWKQAVRGFERAVGAARETGDADLAAVALANLALVAVEAGAKHPSPALLRLELGRSRSPNSRFFCAWALTKVYMYCHDLRKAAFYGRIALQAAPRKYRASAEQSLGIILLAQCDYQGALVRLRRAQDRWPVERAPRVLGLSALAYLWSLKGDRRQARRMVEVVVARSGELERYPAWYRHPVGLSIGFSLLELGDAEGAFHHAEDALGSLDGLGLGGSHEHKMALYLAAEAALDRGAAAVGEHYADQLVRTYYPGQSELRHVLMAIRTSGMVNWLA